MRYTVVLEQEGDGGYVAIVPALPGCVSQGDDRAEALANVREAIELYIEDCREAGVFRFRPRSGENSSISKQPNTQDRNPTGRL